MSNCYSFGPNPGYLLKALDPNALLVIKREVEAIKSNPTQSYAPNLVGNISGEYTLTACRPALQWALQDLVEEYVNTYNYKISVTTPITQKLVLDDLWVNFQYRHQYNPPHKHSGVLSFALWLEIPYTLEEEALAAPQKNYNKPPTGDFEFIWSDTIGRTQYTNLYIDKSKEGYVCIFPSELTHAVSPFYTDTTLPRISISGNYKYSI